MRLGFRRELVSKQAKTADSGQLMRDQGHSHVRESALGLDLPVFPISSENEINSFRRQARLELDRKTDFNGPVTW